MIKCKCLICTKEVSVTIEVKNESVFMVNGNNVVWDNTDMECLICNECDKILADLTEHHISFIYAVNMNNTTSNVTHINIVDGIVVQRKHPYPPGVVFVNAKDIQSITTKHKLNINT